MSAAPAAAGTGARSSVSRPPRRDLKRLLLVFAALLVLLLLAVLSAPWWFDARRVAGLALDRAGTATGLDWRIDGEPELRWRPRPWLALPGLEIRDTQGRSVFAARRVELALPWSTLRGEALRIEALRIDAPVIDVDAALDWWSAQPEAEIATLPELDGLLVTDGRLHWSGTGVDQLQLALPRFKAGEAMALEASGRVSLRARPSTPQGESNAGPADPAGPEASTRAPFRFRVVLQATPLDEPLRLEEITLSLSGDGPVPDATLAGRLQFAPWQLKAEGALPAWSAAWPPLPAPLSENAAPIAFAITQDGVSATDAEAVLTLRRADAAIELRGAPGELVAWSKADDAPLLPPLAGHAELPAVELDGVRLEGIRIEIDESDAGTAASPDDEAKPRAESIR